MKNFLGGALVGLAVGLLLTPWVELPWGDSEDPRSRTVSSASSDPCMPCLAEFVDRMRTEVEVQGWIGVGIKATESNPGKMEVSSISSEGPAASSDLQVGDFIIGIGEVFFEDRNVLAGFDQYKSVLRQSRPGDLLTLHVSRGEQLLEIEVVADRLAAKTFMREVGSILFHEVRDFRSGGQLPPSTKRLGPKPQ